MFKGMKQWIKRSLKIRFGENNDASEGGVSGDLSTAKSSGAGSLCSDGCKPSSQTSRNTLTVLADNFRLVKGRYREISPMARTEENYMSSTDNTRQ